MEFRLNVDVFTAGGCCRGGLRSWAEVSRLELADAVEVRLVKDVFTVGEFCGCGLRCWIGGEVEGWIGGDARLLLYAIY